MALARLVPGLETSELVPPHHLEVRMVQISGVVPPSDTASVTAASVTSGTGTVVLRPGPSGLVTQRPGVARPGQTTIRLSPVTR